MAPDAEFIGVVDQAAVVLAVAAAPVIGVRRYSKSGETC